MQLIKVKDGSYERYEKLLLKRDQLEKDAAQILISYTREFGDLLTESFEAKVACIRLKKEIAWCQAQINRGEKIDADSMKMEIDRVMASFYRELADMYAETKAAQDCERISEVTMLAVKRIYRKLAKLLHPDINPMTAKHPELSDLWNRISLAYNANDLEELRELLDDPEAVEAKKEELKKERDEYLQYKEELSRMLDDLLHSGGGHVTWRMNLQ